MGLGGSPHTLRRLLIVMQMTSATFSSFYVMWRHVSLLCQGEVLIMFYTEDILLGKQKRKKSVSLRAFFALMTEAVRTSETSV
jgi:hypothetical protein